MSTGEGGDTDRAVLFALVTMALRRDLPSRVQQLGVRVTVVTARTSSRRLLAEQ